MHVQPLLKPIFVLAGFIVGGLVGITGTGGGSLMTPLLILFGIHPAMAVGTDLLYASITKAGGTLVHGYNHGVDWPVVARLAAGSIPAAIVTLALLYECHVGSRLSQQVITKVLALVLLLTSLSLAFRNQMGEFRHGAVARFSARRTPALTVAGGALLGVLVSISSVGAGAIGVTCLILLYPRMPVARIVGSDITHAVPLTLVAGLGHLEMGAVDTSLLLTLLLGSLPGILISSYMAPKIPERAVRLSLAGALLVVCTKMIFY